MNTQVEHRIRPILAALKAGIINRPRDGSPSRPPCFVTITRQAGAGGHSLAHNLAERLNHITPLSPPWTCWDRELVEKVAADRGISRQLVESFEDHDRSWFAELLNGLATTESSEHADDFRVYRHVAATIRALAQAGHVILVGRGSVYITRNLPGGVHVRLVAPFAHRVSQVARKYQLSEHEAAIQVRQRDRNRDAFYRRYWPGEVLSPQTFTLTLNTAEIDDQTLVDCLIPLIANPRRPVCANPAQELLSVQ